MVACRNKQQHYELRGTVSARQLRAVRAVPRNSNVSSIYTSSHTLSAVRSRSFTGALGAAAETSGYLPGRELDWSFAGINDGDTVPSNLPKIKYNVKTFGAKGDGEADDTAALLAAVAAANVAPGVVFLPAGSYLLSRPLVITTSNVTLRGEGMGLSRILIRNSLSGLKSMWGSGGAFIQFSGEEPEGSDRTDTRVALLTGVVPVGATRLPVAFLSQPAVGQMVRLFVNGAATTTEAAPTGRRLQQEDASSGDGRGQPAAWQVELRARLAAMGSSAHEELQEDFISEAADADSESAQQAEAAATAAAGAGRSATHSASFGTGEASWRRMQPQLELVAAAAAAELSLAAAQGSGGQPGGEANVLRVRQALGMAARQQGDEAAARVRLHLHQLYPELDSAAVEPQQAVQQDADASWHMRRRLLQADDRNNEPSLGLVTIPGRLAADPVFAAAARAVRLLSSSEPELTLADAWEANSAADPQASSTIAAWKWASLDSNATVLDELSFSAKVTAVGSNWVQLDRALPFPVLAGQTGWVHIYSPSLSEAGVEQLTIEFDDQSPSRYQGHGFDRGYNALGFYAASNVTIVNAENGVFAQWVDHASLLDVTVLSTQQRADPADQQWQRQGHHAIALAMSHSVLAQRFRVAVRYWHDLSLGRGALLNVFNGGAGLDLNVWQETGSLGNLFSDIDVGYGDRTFTADNGAEAHTALRRPAPSPHHQQCDGILLGIEFAGSDLSSPQSGLPTITACYAACKAIKNCAAFTYTAAVGGCAFRGISNWVLQTSPGSQSVVMCVDTFPASDYSPPLPPPRTTRRMLAGPASSQQAPAAASRWTQLRALLGKREDEHNSPAPAPAPAPAATQPASSDGGGTVPALAWTSEVQQSLLGVHPWQADAVTKPVPASGQEGGWVSAAALDDPGLFLPLETPPCSLGVYLNFVGAYRSRNQCLEQDWLIEPLDFNPDAPLPADLYAQQRLARLAAHAPAPAPSGQAY
ncbi:hypothetical protein ACK3TF_006150 [Chlorella vulgaris]